MHVGGVFFQQFTNRFRAYRDDQQSSRLDRPLQIRFAHYSVLTSELLQFFRMPIMHDDRPVEVGEPQSRNQGAGNTAATEEDERLHENPAQVCSAASIRVSTSAAV